MGMKSFAGTVSIVLVPWMLSAAPVVARQAAGLGQVAVPGQAAGPDAAGAPAVEVSGPQVVTLPVGTAIPIRLGSEIDTKKVKMGDTFRGTTASNVQWKGYPVIPAGTPVIGSVMDAKEGGRFSGMATLSLQLVSLRLPTRSGVQEVAMATQPLTSQGASKGGSTAARTGVGAVLGTVVGAVAGGGTGAIVGGVGGGAVGAGSSGITPGKQIDLKVEQLLQFTTSAPLDVVIHMEHGRQIQAPVAGDPMLQARPVPASPQ